MAQPWLYSWGVIQFTIWPVNVHEVDHLTGTDWARKEIAGAAIYREWVGEGDEEIHLRGKLFPHYFAKMARQRSGNAANDGSSRGASGLSTIDALDNMRRLGQAHALIRGDGHHFGWYVIEKLSRGHAFLGSEGIGQQVSFEATFQRVPVPDDPALYFSSFWGIAGSGGGAGQQQQQTTTTTTPGGPPAADVPGAT